MHSTTIEKRFSKIPAVCKRTARSRSSIYKAISEGKFPKPYKIGDRAVAFLDSEIDQWIDAKTAKAGL
jgi:prophage regulatory protein